MALISYIPSVLFGKSAIAVSVKTAADKSTAVTESKDFTSGFRVYRCEKQLLLTECINTDFINIISAFIRVCKG